MDGWMMNGWVDGQVKEYLAWQLLFTIVDVCSVLTGLVAGQQTDRWPDVSTQAERDIWIGLGLLDACNSHSYWILFFLFVRAFESLIVGVLRDVLQAKKPNR